LAQDGSGVEGWLRPVRVYIVSGDRETASDARRRQGREGLG